MKLSVYIVTLNEAARLPQTIKAASAVADDIVVVDSGSTDGTVEAAERLGARVIFHAWKNISSQKQFAQNQCLYDWVLSLDADEVLSPDLIAEINRIKADPVHQAYRVRIGDMFPGFKKPRRLAQKYNLVRLYDRRLSTMPDDLTHDRVRVGKNVSVGQLKGLIHHYSYLSLHQTWVKYNLYTDELVKTALVKGKKYSRVRLVTEFPRQFFIYYIVRRQIFNGLWGLVMATTLAYFRFLKIAKYFEAKQGLTFRDNTLDEFV